MTTITGKSHSESIPLDFLDRRGEYWISDDPDRVNVDVIHEFLTRSYWARGVTRALVEKSIDGCLPFGLYHGSDQIGFARIITDYATFAYVSDVFVLEGHRRRGLARWLMKVILGHPRLQGLRRWMLATRDAHEIYRQVGFEDLPRPEMFMQIFNGKIEER